MLEADVVCQYRCTVPLTESVATSVFFRDAVDDVGEKYRCRPYRNGSTDVKYRPHQRRHIVPI
jgi:hypothetical protein